MNATFFSALRKYREGDENLPDLILKYLYVALNFFYRNNNKRVYDFLFDFCVDIQVAMDLRKLQ